MKITKIVFLGVAYSAIILVQSTIVASEEMQSDVVAAAETEEIRQATAETEAIKQKAQKIMNSARRRVIRGNITPEKAIRVIKEQNAIIATATQELEDIITEAVRTVEESDVEQGYVSYFLSGAQGLGARALAPFKSGYGYTEQEKKIAREMIEGLKKQKKEISRDYKNAIERTEDRTKKAALREGHIVLIEQLDNEIYQQQLIAGELMSSARKLFWAAVAAGSVVAGMSLVQQYREREAAELNAEKLVVREAEQFAQEEYAKIVAAKEAQKAADLAKEMEKVKRKKIEKTRREAGEAFEKEKEAARRQAIEQEFKGKQIEQNQLSINRNEIIGRVDQSQENINNLQREIGNLQQEIDTSKEGGFLSWFGFGRTTEKIDKEKNIIQAKIQEIENELAKIQESKNELDAINKRMSANKKEMDQIYKKIEGPSLWKDIKEKAGQMYEALKSYMK